MRHHHITPSIAVDLDTAHELWTNGRPGDHRVTLMESGDRQYVWAETNGDPVAQRDDLLSLLIAEGMDAGIAERALDGDTSGLI